jgi:F0F1-type ATP synthase membrane subunit b/b'
MTFLYNLMGISAFAGILCLVIGSPLNSLLARRALNIQKGLLAARDKRMGIVNEVVTGVKFIKFFAWEGKWIGKVMEARKKEIKWLISGETNAEDLMFF